MNLIRSNRRTIAIIIERDGSLTVRAPKRVPRTTIEAFLADKSDWIRTNQERMRKSQPPSHRFVEGEIFYYLGEAYPLKYVQSQHPGLILKEAFFLNRKAASRAKEYFEKWYKQQARKSIGERLARLSVQHGYRFSSLRITSARTRWGSCSSRGTLSFSYRLVMAPPEVLDSVIIHELIHLDVPNHSPAFWARFQQIMPDCKKHRKWLQQNGSLFSLD
jgi:hypothetical protein